MRRLLLAFLALAALSLLPRPALAQRIKVGVRIGEYSAVGIHGYDEYDRLFLGGDLNVPMGDRFYLNPAVELVFVDHGTYLTVPVDLTYRVAIGRRRKGFVWLGGGPDVIYGSASGFSRTELSADLQAGIGLHAGGSEPWFGVKYILGSSDFDPSGVLTFGIRF